MLNGIPPGATHQLLYVNKSEPTKGMLCFRINGQLEMLYMSGTTKPWTPTSEWELKSELDVKTGKIIGPIPVGMTKEEFEERIEKERLAHAN